LKKRVNERLLVILDMQSKYDRISLLLNELDNEQNISMFMQSLDKITQEVIDICREFYKNNEYLTILQFYNLITSQYEKMISIIKKNSSNETYINSQVQKSYNSWKKNESRIKQDLIQITITKGDLFLSEGKYEEGLSIFKNITNYEKNNVEVWKKIGITYFVLQQYEKALECFNTVLQLDKKDLHTFYNIGLTYELLYDTNNIDLNKSDTNNTNIKKYYENAALIYYKIALTANPNHFESLVALGIYFYKLGDYHQSKKQLELASNIRNNDWRLLLAMGCLLSDGYNQYKEAKEYFVKSLSFNSNSNVAKLNLSQVLILLNESDKSQKYLEEILVKLTEIEDRSTAIILRILSICSTYFNEKKISQKCIDELLEYSELKNLRLVKWNFNNLINYIKKSEIDNKTKKLLISILSISKIEEGSKDKFLDDIRRLTKSIQTNTAGKINVISKSEPDKNNSGWYYWRVKIEGSDNVLSSINSIEYILDPTYKHTKKTIKSKNNGFLIKGKGWSDFDLIILIHFKNGKKLKKYHKIILAQS
jgi:tetratricopeptide (TPR) repeat protein